MASNLDFTQEIEENRINEIIEATLAMSAKMQTAQQGIKHLNHGFSNDLVVSKSGAASRIRINKSENKRIILRPKILHKTKSNHERRHTNRRSCEKQNSDHEAHLQILMNKNTSVKTSDSQTRKKIISRPIPILQPAKPRYANVNSQNESPRSLILGSNEIHAQGSNCSDPLNAVNNIERKRLNSSPGSKEKPGVVVSNTVSCAKNEQRYSRMLDIFSEYDDILPNTTENEGEKEKHEITAAPSPLAFSYTQGLVLGANKIHTQDSNCYEPLNTVNNIETKQSNSFRGSKEKSDVMVPHTVSCIKNEERDSGMFDIFSEYDDVLVTTADNETEKEKQEITVSPSPPAFSYTQSLILGASKIHAQDSNCSDPMNAANNMETKQFSSFLGSKKKLDVMVPSTVACDKNEERDSGMLDIFSEYDDVLPNTADNECEKEKHEVTASPSPLAFSYTQGNFFMKKRQSFPSSKSSEDRKTDLFSEIFLESTSSKSLPSSGGASSEKTGPACESDSEVGQQSVNIPHSFKSSSSKTDNVTSTPARQKNKNKIFRHSFSEFQVRTVANQVVVPYNCHKLQSRNLEAFDIIEAPNNLGTSDMEDLLEKTKTSQEGKVTSAKEIASQTDILPMLSPSERGVNKKPKPPVPPKPRLKLKEHATGASKTPSYCGNGKVNPTPVQKRLDKMLCKQAEAWLSRSQMYENLKLFQDESNFETSKEIITENVGKERRTFQSKSNATESRELQDSLNQDIAARKVIANEENVTISMSKNSSTIIHAPTIMHPLMSEYEGTLKDVEANSSNVSHFTRY